MAQVSTTISDLHQESESLAMARSGNLLKTRPGRLPKDKFNLMDFHP